MTSIYNGEKRNKEPPISHDSTESAHVSSVPHDQHSSLQKFPTNNNKKEDPVNSNPSPNPILETTETTEEETMLSHSELRQHPQPGSGLNPREVLDVNVSVPIAAPISVTLDDSFPGQVSFPTMDNDNDNVNTVNTGNNANVRSHSLASHQYHQYQQQQQLHHHDLNLNSHSMHGVSLLVPVPVPDTCHDHDPDHHQITGREMIDTDQHSQPPTPQFDSNATQMDDFEGHQVHVNVEMHGHGHGGQIHGFSHDHLLQHHAAMHNGHETMIPIQQATEMNRSVQETVNDVIEHFSKEGTGVEITADDHHEFQRHELAVHGNYNDNNNDDDNFSDDENEVNAEDTLELLKATPLAVTPEDFENKFPAHMEQAPADSTPIEHPNPSDILFGRGGLTNHHEGML